MSRLDAARAARLKALLELQFQEALSSPPKGSINIGLDNCALNANLQALLSLQRVRAWTMNPQQHRDPLSTILRQAAEPDQSVLNPVQLASELVQEEKDMQRCAFQCWEQLLELLGPEVDELFRMRALDVTKCLSCHRISESAVMLNSIILSVSADPMADYFTSQLDDYLCSSCSTRQKATLCRTIVQWPPVLLVTYQRALYFSDHSVKDRRRVPFTLQVQLQGSPAYRLAAFIVHRGSTARRGHYVCIMRAGATWYLVDDERVQVITEKRVLQEQPTMLFYECL